MKKAICKLKSLSPVTFGKFHDSPKLDKERPDDYELRTWREKAHFDTKGNLKIPGIMFANCIRESAKYLSKPIPGKGKATFTKHFDAGISILTDIVTSVDRDKLTSTTQHVPSDGRPGGTTRVKRIFPIVHEWEGEITVHIGDNVITPDVFEEVIINAGQLIGIGTWRPRNRGMNGRFELVDMKWIEE